LPYLTFCGREIEGLISHYPNLTQSPYFLCFGSEEMDTQSGKHLASDWHFAKRLEEL